MCGICGIWEYGASEGRVGLSLVESMRDEMRHRGPDDEGSLLFDQERGGLGFRRLEISRCMVARKASGWFSTARFTTTHVFVKASNNAATFTIRVPTRKPSFTSTKSAASISSTRLTATLR